MKDQKILKAALSQDLLSIKELNAARRLLTEALNNRIVEEFDNDGMYTSYAKLALELLKVLKAEGYTKRTLSADNLQGVEDWATYFYTHNGKEAAVDMVLIDELILDTEIKVNHVKIIFNYKAVNTLIFCVLIKCVPYIKKFQSCNISCIQFKVSNQELALKMIDIDDAINKEILREEQDEEQVEKFVKTIQRVESYKNGKLICVEYFDDGILIKRITKNDAEFFEYLKLIEQKQLEKATVPTGTYTFKFDKVHSCNVH